MRNLFKTTIIFSIILSVFLFSFKGASSQSLPQPYSTDFNMEFSPKNLESNTDVTARIVSYGTNINNVYISWVLNGAVIEKGTGKTTAQFNTGEAGATLSLSVTVGETKKTFSLKIADIDLIYEAQTYSPFFYKGKAKPIEGAPVKIIAMAHGLGDRNKLLYEWERDYKKVSSASGIGKSGFTFTPFEISNKETVNVKISTTDGKYSIEKSITVKKENPEVIFYKEDPALGPLFNNALTSQTNLLGGSETLIRAEPYFSPLKYVGQLSYAWTMNNQNNLNYFSRPNIIGVNVPENESGQSFIEVHIRAAQTFLEDMANSLYINF